MKNYTLDNQTQSDLFAQKLIEDTGRVKAFVLQHFDNIDYQLIWKAYEKLWIQQVEKLTLLQVEYGAFLAGSYVENGERLVPIRINFSKDPIVFNAELIEKYSSEVRVQWKRWAAIKRLFLDNRRKLPKTLNNPFYWYGSAYDLLQLVSMCSAPLEIWKGNDAKDFNWASAVTPYDFDINGMWVKVNRKKMVTVTGENFEVMENEYQRFLSIQDKYTESARYAIF